jgi:hypothetical protein
MSMNLIQIQDKLKNLPNDPRVMQLLTGYANGQNPHVPPYLALGELNRRKVEAEKNQMQQAGQPPGGTVKDQIEQQTGVMALKQGQQQQAVQNMVRQGMAGPAPVPQNTPQPQAQVAAAAGGGLASLAPKGYRSGGVIAFQKAGSVDQAVEDEEGEDEDKIDAGGMSAASVMADLARQRMMAERLIKNMKAPSAETPMEFRARMIKEKPEYAYLAEDPEKDVVGRLDELQKARRDELALQKEELAKSKPGILQLLGQAAMNSRGQQGKSALASILGNYSELSSGADAKKLQQEQALRAKDLELQQAKMETITKLRDLKRARDEGDIDAEQKAKLDLAKLAQQQGTTVSKLVGEIFKTTGSLAGRLGAAETNARAKVNAAAITSSASAEEKRQKRLMDNAQFLEKMEATWASTIGKDPDYKELSRQKGFIELQRSTEKNPTKLAKLDAQLDDVNTSMIELSNKLRGKNVGGGGAGSSTQTGKAPPPPPGFKVN